MVTIKLELWENPNFPQLDILENQTNEVLEAFNKCRKLELELHGNDTEIKKFNISINTLTERRAQESFKHSSYSKNVAIYMDALSKESETVEAILIILSSLLVEARNRRESTNRLRQDYQDFLENFNNYYVIDNLNNEQIEIKNPEFVIPILSFLFSTFIFYLNMNCDPLSSNQDNACNNIPEILWRTLGHNASKDKKSPNDEEKQKDKEPQKDKKSSNDEKKQKDKEPQKDKKSNDEKEQKDEGLRGGKKSSNYEEKQKEEELKKDNNPLNNEKELKDRQSPKNEKSQNEKKKEEITTWCPSWLPWLCYSKAPLSNTISTNDTNNQTNGGTYTNDTNNQINAKPPNDGKSPKNGDLIISQISTVLHPKNFPDDKESQKDEDTQKDRESQNGEEPQNGKESQNGGKISKDEINIWCPSWLSWLCNFEESLPNTISANDTNNQTSGGTHTNDTNNQTNGVTFTIDTSNKINGGTHANDTSDTNNQTNGGTYTNDTNNQINAKPPNDGKSPKNGDLIISQISTVLHPKNFPDDKESQKDEDTQKDRESQNGEEPQNGKESQNGGKIPKDEITTWCPSWLSWLCNFEESLPNTISANDTNNQTNGGTYTNDTNNQTSGGTHTNDTNNQTNQTSGFSLSNQMNPVHPNVVNNHTNEINQTDQIHVSQYVNAIVFGILIALLMWILLRITKPKLYLPWMKDRKRKSQRLEELSQQKNNKIFEIKNKLPVIITNVDILYQFWDNQIDCITNNSNTLRSVDEKEKIKIPKKLALSIEEDWRNQSNSCEENYVRMKHLVTFNFILTE
ncbi:hypothetical protein GLOIN_2v1879977 [Rhizophagus irregularis DAOM 181602=DAOM 197198]|uniref:Uncharacterized protein n=1 Tax=Rhizophagus irregularis (strain DAOM 181602 / DAOM 197198 / MUCL 43194) TaxID=747089 RepID=A0A2P4PLJ5_RHIID|nr:hypothetical protein GLOIN_2v1879977 [Rhizophagus irregularis DAOM 181602=DAOM 197198]POG66251.1 hypothetical protein GLOIN_2v1879977 [Rhizophagus irregularis DAOM 181602=DAOM 197198]|eukprot:XP_025173117.1 hypothetical protein GLOIN_2v1879977 [Rhizophagus irregularis DAOM 181602=DAOM 197198]